MATLLLSEWAAIFYLYLMNLHSYFYCNARLNLSWLRGAATVAAAAAARMVVASIVCDGGDCTVKVTVQDPSPSPPRTSEEMSISGLPPLYRCDVRCSCP